MNREARQAEELRIAIQREWSRRVLEVLEMSQVDRSTTQQKNKKENDHE